MCKADDDMNLIEWERAVKYHTHALHSTVQDVGRPSVEDPYTPCFAADDENNIFGMFCLEPEGGEPTAVLFATSIEFLEYIHTINSDEDNALDALSYMDDDEAWKDLR